MSAFSTTSNDNIPLDSVVLADQGDSPQLSRTCQLRRNHCHNSTMMSRPTCSPAVGSKASSDTHCSFWCGAAHNFALVLVVQKAKEWWILDVLPNVSTRFGHMLDACSANLLSSYRWACPASISSCCIWTVAQRRRYHVYLVSHKHFGAVKSLEKVAQTLRLKRTTYPQTKGAGLAPHAFEA